MQLYLEELFSSLSRFPGFKVSQDLAHVGSGTLGERRDSRRKRWRNEKMNNTASKYMSSFLLFGERRQKIKGDIAVRRRIFVGFQN